MGPINKISICTVCEKLSNNKEGLIHLDCSGFTPEIINKLPIQFKDITNPNHKGIWKVVITAPEKLQIKPISYKSNIIKQQSNYISQKSTLTKPCPTCRTSNQLTPKMYSLGHQCNRCNNY